MREFANRLEQINIVVGRLIGWLTLGMVLITGLVVFNRYFLQIASIRMQESVTLMHAAVFMLAAAYTLAAGNHVRVDIFYSKMTPRGQACVNLAGTLLLLFPVAGFLLGSSWDFVSMAWQIRESSSEAGGLPHPFPAIMKSFIPIAAVLLIMQGLSMLLRSASVLMQRPSVDS